MSRQVTSIAELSRKMRRREVTSEALVRNSLDLIAQRDEALHCFITVDTEGALDDARRADAELATGLDRGLLHGVPVAIKDIIDVAGLPTTCQSRRRTGHVAASDSHVAARLRANGAILLGKTNTWQFARGEPGDNLAFPPALNPVDTDRTPGGSSSGSAAAVAADYVRAALGTDSGGSNRFPAACCGVVGFKPTFGLVGRSGIFPLSRRSDHCGPITASVEDAAIVLAAIVGSDPGDPDCADSAPADYLSSLRGGVEGMRFGVPAAWYRNENGCNNQVAALDLLCDELSRRGAAIREVTPPPYRDFVDFGGIVMSAEGYAVHAAALAEHASDYDPPTYDIFMGGSGFSPGEVEEAWQQCRRLRREVSALFESVDLLILPTMLEPPLRLGQPASPDNVLTKPFNVTGHPAIAVPNGRNADGLPLSVQIAGPHREDARVLRAAWTVEAIVSCGPS